jgi:hypothetical protein
MGQKERENGTDDASELGTGYLHVGMYVGWRVDRA